MAPQHFRSTFRRFSFRFATLYYSLPIVAFFHNFWNWFWIQEVENAQIKLFGYKIVYFPLG